MSICKLLALAKGEPMVEPTTDEDENFLESEEESDSNDSTSSGAYSVPELVDSFYTCKIA